MDDASSPEMEYGPETAYLGRFDPLEMPILIEVLGEHGIFAITKAALSDGEANVYPGLIGESRRVLLVDRAKLDEAKRIIAEEIPARLEEMRSELGEIPEELPADLMPFGWFAPNVARVLLEILKDAEIRALPEYPLDAPPPPYARPDGRVRVHVEELMTDVAVQIVETDLADELAARGIAFSDPLRSSDDT